MLFCLDSTSPAQHVVYSITMHFDFLFQPVLEKHIATLVGSDDMHDTPPTKKPALRRVLRVVLPVFQFPYKYSVTPYCVTVLSNFFVLCFQTFLPLVLLSIAIRNFCYISKKTKHYKFLLPRGTNLYHRGAFRTLNLFYLLELQMSMGNSD